MKQFQFLMLIVVLTENSGGPVMTAIAFNGQTPSTRPAAAKSDDGSRHQIYGTIRSIDRAQLTIETRDKRFVKVDATAAIKGQRTVILAVGRPIIASGPYDAKGVLHADTIQRAKESPTVWLADH